MRKNRLQGDIHHLAIEIGPRNIHHYPSLRRAAQHIESTFYKTGYVPARQDFEAKGKSFANIIGEKLGAEAPAEIFIVGAHYDTHKNSPGANDKRLWRSLSAGIPDDRTRSEARQRLRTKGASDAGHL